MGYVHAAVSEEEEDDEGGVRMDLTSLPLNVTIAMNFGIFSESALRKGRIQKVSTQRQVNK